MLDFLDVLVFLISHEGTNYIGVILVLFQTFNLFFKFSNLVILLKFDGVTSSFKQIYHLFVIKNKVNPRRVDTINLDFVLDEGFEVLASGVFGTLLDFSSVNLFEFISVSC